MKMNYLTSVVQLLVCFCLIQSICSNLQDEEAEAKEQLLIWNAELEEVNFNYFSSFKAYKQTKNMRNKRLFRQAIAKRDELQKDIRNKISRFNFNDFNDKNLKRRLKMMTNLGDELLPQFKYNAMHSVLSAMERNYAEMKIPKYGNEIKDLSLNPDITRIMEKSRDPEELKYYWLQWYTKLGRKNKNKYPIYVKLRNEAAKLNSETLMA